MMPDPGHVTLEDVDVATLFLDLISSLIIALWTLVGVAIAGGVGIGAFMARTNGKLTRLTDDVHTIRRAVFEDFASRLRNVESRIDRGILPEADTRLGKVEERLGELDRAP